MLRIRKPRSPSAAAIACTFVLSISACNKAAGAPQSVAATGETAGAKGVRVSACSLLTKAEIAGITGQTITVAEPNDDGHSSESGCRFTTESNPAVGVSLDVSWVSASDYSDPAEHAALQKASIGGATLGGKLTAGMPGASLPGLHAGPVEGVGDEATQSMLLLTARKGDYTVMVQVAPSDPMKFVTDSTVAIALQEQEKTIARKSLAKL